MSPEEMKTELLRRRILAVWGDVTVDSVRELTSNLMRLLFESAEPIHFFFDSGGGRIRPALHLYDAMICHENKVEMTGIVVGECSSAATFILLGCTKRLSLPHSRYMLHHLTTTFEFSPENPDVEGQLNQILADSRETTNQIVAVYVDRCGCDEATARQWLEKGSKFDHLLYATQAKEIGLITEIVKTYPPITDLVGVAMSNKEAS